MTTCAMVIGSPPVGEHGANHSARVRYRLHRTGRCQGPVDGGCSHGWGLSSGRSIRHLRRKARVGWSVTGPNAAGADHRGLACRRIVTSARWNATAAGLAPNVPGGERTLVAATFGQTARSRMATRKPFISVRATQSRRHPAIDHKSRVIAPRRKLSAPGRRSRGMHLREEAQVPSRAP